MRLGRLHVTMHRNNHRANGLLSDYRATAQVADLHFATDIAWVRLSSFNFFSGGLHKTIFFRKSAFRPFKVIQGD